MVSTYKRPGTCPVSLVLLLAAVVWEHGKIPDDPACENAAVRQLPTPLRALFTAPDKWLEQLTPVKLSCLAQAHQKLRPDSDAEPVLIQKMKAAIQVCVPLFCMEPKQEITAL